MSRDALIASLRPALMACRGVELVVLFGSRARGDASSGSDADLAVLGDGVDLFELASALERAVSVPIDVIDLGAASYPLLLSVLRDGVCALERSPGAYARFVSASLADLETDLPNLRLMQRAFVERVASRGLFSAGQ
jgi:predicted nucleotidyltransferase